MGMEDLLTEAGASVLNKQQPQQGGMPMTSMQPQLQMPQPLPHMQMQQPQQFGKPTGGFRSSGERQRADRQALLGNTASLIKSGTDYIQAKKTRALSMDIERLLSAQEGLKEAQASGDQKAVEHNTAIINDITSDPKKLKQLQKAFNIDLFGTSNGKNKNENQALMDAWKSFQQKKQGGDQTALNPAAQKMMQSMPQRQQISQALQTQMALTKAGVLPDANAQLNAMTQKANEQMRMTIERERMKTDLKIAEMAASKIGGEGVNVVDSDPNSLTGIQRLQMSADGKNIRRTQNVVLPSVLPSEHDGITTLVVPDPNSPTGSSIARVPNASKTSKSIPGAGVVGAGGIINRGNNGGQQGGQGQQPKVKTNPHGVPTDGAVENSHSTAKSLGLPAGSVVISSKALTPEQVAKLRNGVTAIDGTITKLKELRAYTDVYEDMFKAGKVKLTTDTRTGKRILGGWLSSTDDEKKAASAWQQSAEYMNTFREALNANGFRSIPAYDNMLALRGQLWQDKTILNKTLDDSISFMTKERDLKAKMTGVAEDARKKDENSDTQNPAGLKF